MRVAMNRVRQRVQTLGPRAPAKLKRGVVPGSGKSPTLTLPVSLAVSHRTTWVHQERVVTRRPRSTQKLGSGFVVLLGSVIGCSVAVGAIRNDVNTVIAAVKTSDARHADHVAASKAQHSEVLERLRQDAIRHDAQHRAQHSELLEQLHMRDARHREDAIRHEAQHAADVVATRAQWAEYTAQHREDAIRHDAQHAADVVASRAQWAEYRAQDRDDAMRRDVQHAAELIAHGVQRCDDIAAHREVMRDLKHVITDLQQGRVSGSGAAGVPAQLH